MVPLPLMAPDMHEVPFPFQMRWPVHVAAELACILEATAPKVGNVHPNASFLDMQFSHFLVSAISLRQSLEQDPQCRTGKQILECVEHTRRRVKCNTNLGMALLIVPLAQAVKRSAQVTRSSIQESILHVLNDLDEEDTRNIYAAIRNTKPGGLGKVDQDDIEQDPPANIVQAMRQVADFDAVARQYTNGFTDLFSQLLPALDAELQRSSDPLQAILHLQLYWLATEPDGLIHRKCGADQAADVQRFAQSVLAIRGTPAFTQGLNSFDAYLRSDGNRLNPGTTADLIAATLFLRLVCEP